MLLTRARIKGYRSIKDAGYFDVEDLNPLRDYPRSEYSSDIVNGGIDKSNFEVVEGIFKLNDNEKKEVPEYINLNYHFLRKLD